jgi:hypothetical protein
MLVLTARAGGIGHRTSLNPGGEVVLTQFTPDVSEADARDLPLENQEEIRKIIRQVEVREKPRVVLACADSPRLSRGLPK